MKKNITVACFAVAALGFSSTSALAAKKVSTKEPTKVSIDVLRNNAAALNTILAERKVIGLIEWSVNFEKIASAKTEQQLQSVYDEIYRKVMTSAL